MSSYRLNVSEFLVQGTVGGKEYLRHLLDITAPNAPGAQWTANGKVIAAEYRMGTDDFCQNFQTPPDGNESHLYHNSSQNYYLSRVIPGSNGTPGRLELYMKWGSSPGIPHYLSAPVSGKTTLPKGDFDGAYIVTTALDRNDQEGLVFAAHALDPIINVDYVNIFSKFGPGYVGVERWTRTYIFNGGFDSVSAGQTNVSSNGIEEFIHPSEQPQFQRSTTLQKSGSSIFITGLFAD